MRVALADLLARAPFKLTLAWLPPALYMALIFALSSKTVDVPLPSVPMGDKGIHFLEYGGLALMLANAVQLSWPARPLRYVAAGWVSVLFGLSDELHQAYVPGRSAEVPDLIADALGTLLGLALYAALYRVALLVFKRTPDAPAA